MAQSSFRSSAGWLVENLVRLAGYLFLYSIWVLIWGGGAYNNWIQGEIILAGLAAFFAVGPLIAGLIYFLLR